MSKEVVVALIFAATFAVAGLIILANHIYLRRLAKRREQQEAREAEARIAQDARTRLLAESARLGMWTAPYSRAAQKPRPVPYSSRPSSRYSSSDSSSYSYSDSPAYMGYGSFDSSSSSDCSSYSSSDCSSYSSSACWSPTDCGGGGGGD